MSPLRVGILIAVVVAGPPLYSLVQEGSLDTTSAMIRGCVVAIGCAIGAWLIGQIVDGYQREAQRAAKLAALTADPTVHEGTVQTPGERSAS